MLQPAEEPPVRIVEPEGSEQPAAAPKREDQIQSRSRSTSPSAAVRQTASPVKSLPPVISVTLDSITHSSDSSRLQGEAATSLSEVTSHGAQPQRAVISYRTSQVAEEGAQAARKKSPPSRETSQSPPLPTPSPQLIALSQIPPEFYALRSPPPAPPSVEVEPSIADVAGQLFRALGQAGNRSLRNFVDYLVSRFSVEDGGVGAGVSLGEEKLRRIELAVCALLVVIAGLILMFVCNPRTVTHHHHWDYFNPPQ